ncbi:hypothetical protein LTR86_005493 [Recurvomyces mirabilis]|nr:hypothetical protein LTR86_005493 [Recurvomyces mirabilis]
MGNVMISSDRDEIVRGDQNEGRKVFARGWTSKIYAGGDVDKDRVVKVLDRDHTAERKGKSETEIQNYLQSLFDTERRAYERISSQTSQPDSLLRYYGVDTMMPRGLSMELAEGGCFWDHLFVLRGRLPERTAPDMLLKWARQAAEALAFVHELGILHCDVHAANFFLDGDQSLKVADFGAASIDGSKPRLMYRPTHQLWIKDGSGGWRKDISIAAEIFALGSALYNIEAMLEPFQDLIDASDSGSILQRLRERQMPDTGGLVLGQVIQRCWRSEYQTMEDVLGDIPAATAPRRRS